MGFQILRVEFESRWSCHLFRRIPPVGGKSVLKTVGR